MNVKVESEEKDGDSMVIVVSASPGLYRDIEQLVRDETQGAGSLELLCLIEVRDEEKLEFNDSLSKDRKEVNFMTSDDFDDDFNDSGFEHTILEPCEPFDVKSEDDSPAEKSEE